MTLTSIQRLQTKKQVEHRVCRYLHPTGIALKAARQQYMAQAKSRKRRLRQDEGDTHALDAASKSQRAALFAKWLVDTYGVEYLSSGTGTQPLVCDLCVQSSL
jgi:hypothetical protein